MVARLGIGIASFVTSALLLVLLMQVPSSLGWPLTIAAFAAGGLVHGMLYGAVLSRPCAVPVAAGALAAACVLSVPVVLVTFGAALLGAPVVFAFALLVGFAAHFGERLKRGRHAA